MSSLVILESDADELYEIDKRLRKDGFKTEISVEHKLRYLWRQLLRSEASLASSLESVEELRKQHAQEMVEVETYVDHIRQLSSEREALTLELEVENEKLKSDLEDMKEDQDSQMLSLAEITSVLTNSGYKLENVRNKLDLKDCLGNLAKECNQALSKVKHLELENGNLKTSGGASDSHRIQLLEQERNEMENEMKRMQDNMRVVKQEERRIHEEEVNGLKTEKQELQKKFNTTEKKCKDLQIEVLNLKRKMEDEQRAHNKDMTEMIKKQNATAPENQNNGVNTELNKRLTKALEEMDLVQNKQWEVEKQKNELQETVDELEKDLKSEKESFRISRIKDEAIFKDLRKELDASKQQCMELQIKLGRMETEKKHTENKLQQTQQDLSNLQQISSEKDKNLSQELSSFERLQTQIRELTASKEKLSLELEASNETIVEQRSIIDQLTLQLAESKKTINEKDQQSAMAEKELKNEINQLQQQLSLTTSEAIDLRNELTRTKDEYDEVIVRIKQEAEQLNEKYNEDLGKHESTSQEVTALRAQISELKQDLSASLSASVAREQETSGQVESFEKTRNELVAELNRCIEQGKKQKEEFEAQKPRIEQLEQEKSSLQSIVLSQERKVSEIHEKLHQTERKLAEQEGILSYERHRNTDTNQRLEMNVESLSNMKQECESLREELRVLSEKLLKQHDTALESQSKYDSLISQLRTEMQHERETYAVERHKLASHLEQAVKESKDFSSLLRQREEELGQLRKDFNATSRTGTKATTALEFESRLRETLENKNSTLESELAKALGQTKSLVDRLATIEADKDQLERELDRKSQMYQLTEDNLQKKDSDVVSLMVARDTAEQRAEAAELKLMSIQRERENTQHELERTQKELGEAYQMKAELELTREESFTLKSQLDDEEQNRSLHRLTIDELKRQVDMLHGRERQAYEKIDELQKSQNGYEHTVGVLQNKLRQLSNDHKVAEDEGKTMVDKINEIRRANDQLQVDLVVAAERIEYLEGKCERRKMKAIHKIQSLKEKFEREKRTANAALLSLQNSLELSRKKIQKEEEWKETTDGVRRQLVEEKQDLLTRLTESEEIIREHLRNLREAETRLSMLEKENLELRDKVNIVMRQNEHLERLNRILEKPENHQSRSPINGGVNNQSLYDALNRIRLHESLNSTDYSPQTSYTAAYRTPDKSVNSLDGSFIVSPPSGTLVVT